LSFTSPYDLKENTEIREKLSDDKNYEKYLDQVPYKMDIEGDLTPGHYVDEKIDFEE